MHSLNKKKSSHFHTKMMQPEVAPANQRSRGCPALLSTAQKANSILPLFQRSGSKNSTCCRVTVSARGTATPSCGVRSVLPSPVREIENRKGFGEEAQPGRKSSRKTRG